ncbi:MAG: S41 family peptidase [Oscillospiraceae bacterium]|jgi:carboxyl-terminal processing protease|nr:S41 family peptidase [Oscillospiraceae bacterium]
MKKRFTLSTVLALMLLTAAAAALIGYNRASIQLKEQLEVFQSQKEELSKLIAAREIIQDQFVGEVDRVRLYDNAIDGMVRALDDRYSHYLTAEEYARYQRASDNRYVGIGVTAAQHPEGDILVIEVYEDSPAQESGLKPFDRIVEVEGTPVTEMGFALAVGALDGAENTPVLLTVLRPDGTRAELRPVRRTVGLRAVSSEILAGQNIGLVRIRNFESGVDRDFREAVARLQSAGVRALIFDVRFNPGGQLDVMRPMLDMLLPEGTLITLRGKDGSEHVFTSEPGEVDLPMAVLVNGHSYSAAEFFAAALREYDKAVVVGEPTTGKGYAQRTIPLEDQSALILSIVEYFTPQGHSLSGVGLTPDDVVVLSEEENRNFYTLTHEQDRQLQRAIGALTQQLPPLPEEDAAPETETAAP